MIPGNTFVLFMGIRYITEHVNLECKFSGSKTGSTVCVVWRKQNIEKQKITTLKFSILYN